MSCLNYFNVFPNNEDTVALLLQLKLAVFFGEKIGLSS